MADEVTETPGERQPMSGMASVLEGLIPDDMLNQVNQIENNKGLAKPAEANEQKPEENQESNQSATEQQQQVEPKPEGEGEEGAEETPATKAAKEGEKTGEEGEKKSVFGLNKNKQSANDLVIENEAQAIEAINKKFGHDLKSIKDLPKFFESVSKMRDNSQKFKEAQEESKKYKDLLESLPDEFIEGMSAFVKGEDYTKVFTSKPKFDFNKPVEKQDIKELVNHYFPNKFTEEDFADENKSAALEIAEAAAKDKYSVEKQAKDNQRVAAETMAKQRFEAFKKSISNSVDYLKKTFPDTDEEMLKEATQILEGGPQRVVSWFFNEDGTVKQEAAEMFMLAKHGKDEIQKMMRVAARNTESRLNEELVSRGADKPNPVKQQQQAPGSISEETKKLITGLEGFKSKKTY